MLLERTIKKINYILKKTKKDIKLLKIFKRVNLSWINPKNSTSNFDTFIFLLKDKKKKKKKY